MSQIIRLKSRHSADLRHYYLCYLVEEVNNPSGASWLVNYSAPSVATRQVH